MFSAAMAMMMRATSVAAGVAFPTVFGASATGVNLASISLTWPAGHAADDIGIVLISTNNQAVPSTPTGCTPINTPAGVGTSGGVGGARLSAYWIRATSGAQAAIATGDAGNINMARLIVVRGCRNYGSPIEWVSQGVWSAGTTQTFTSQQTLNNKCLIMAACAVPKDANQSNTYSAWTNANLTSLVEHTDEATNSSNGASLGMAYGGYNTSNANPGNTTVTIDASLVGEWCQFALIPKHVSGYPDIVKLTSSQTFNAPYAGNVDIHGWGGGGGFRNTNTGENGGGGGAYSKKTALAVTAAQALTVVVGAAGADSASTPTAGGDTSLVASSTTQMLAKGGGQSTGGGTGGASSGGTGDVKYSGGNGSAGASYNDGSTTWYWEGAGGGAAGDSANGSNATAATQDGGGGGTAGVGGAGGAGTYPGGNGSTAPGGGSGGEGPAGAGQVILVFTPS
jgi:hypothetical protein